MLENLVSEDVKTIFACMEYKDGYDNLISYRPDSVVLIPHSSMTKN